MSTPPPPPISRIGRAWAPLERFRGSLPVVGFVAGAAYDAVTLRRIDQRLDNWLLLAYLGALGLLLTLDRRMDRGGRVPAWLHRSQERLRFFAQFLQGGLFSAYVIFYSKSASAWSTLFFLVPLVVVMLVNEFREGWVEGERVRLLLFAFSAWSLFLFFLPVIFQVGFFWTTVGSAALTMTLVSAVLTVSHVGSTGESPPEGTWLPGDGERREALRTVLRRGMIEVSSLLAVLLLMERMGVIPPVPLAVLEAGIFHEVRREDGDFVLSYRKPSWWRPDRADDRPFLWVDGDVAHCVTAVFAPTGLRLSLYHRWQRWDGTQRAWEDTDRIAMHMLGGRDAGWRGRSEKRRVGPGLWRVLVEREDGREIGRIRFEVVPEGASERIWEERRL